MSFYIHSFIVMIKHHVSEAIFQKWGTILLNINLYKKYYINFCNTNIYCANDAHFPLIHRVLVNDFFLQFDNYNALYFTHVILFCNRIFSEYLNSLVKKYMDYRSNLLII